MHKNRTPEQHHLSSQQADLKAQQAVQFGIQGYMCSESIVMAYAKEFGLDAETAARISGGFAGGMAQRKTCGAVTGAIMVIGLKYGAGLSKDPYLRDMCFQMTQKFSHRFIARRKSMECSDILLMNQMNPKNPETKRRLRREGLCEKIIADAAEILETLFTEEEP